MSLKIHKLLSVSPADLWHKVRGSNIAVDYNGTTVTSTATEIILSSYAWSVASYCGVIPLAEHTITAHYKRGVLNPSSFNSLFNSMLWYCVDTLGIEDDATRIFELVKVIIVANNNLYNDLVYGTSEHIVAIDLLDFINLAEDPTMLQIRAESTADGNTPQAVSDAFVKAEAYVVSDDALDSSSRIAWHCRRSLVKTGQAMQACLMRGYLHDIDRARIDKPILSNLTEGMSLTDYALLSRESSIAMAAGNGDIQRVSVDGRKMSYVGGNRSLIKPGDCGTTEYIRWMVKESDKSALYGTWFYSDDDPTVRLYGKADAIKYNNEHIHRRSPLTCALPNTKHTCSKCFGILSQSIPPNRNVGVTIAKHVASIFVQGTLSTKHHVASMGASKNALDEETAQYFRIKDDAIFVKSITGIKKLELVIPTDSMNDINAVFNVEDVRSITMCRITSISTGVVIATKTQTGSEAFFNVSEGKNHSMVSYDLAEYIQQNKHILTTRADTYILDITEFSKKKPVFIRTAKMANFRDSSSKIIAALERSASIKSNEVFSKAYGIMDTLAWLIELMASKYGISASAVELLFSAYLSETDSYLLPRGLKNAKHRKLHELIRNRSLSAWFLFDRSTEAFTTPGPMLVEKRVNGALDVIVDSGRVLEALEKRKQ